MRSRLLPSILLIFCSQPLLAQDPVDAEPTVQAVKKVLPAVVNINTERTVRRQVSDPIDELFNEYFQQRKRARKEVRQKVQSLGSGFVIDPSGYIITNEHVVERAADLKIQVTFPDGTTLGGVYITGDAKSDLALIKVEAGRPLPYIDLKDLSPNQLGQTVIAVGNPLGYESTVTRGILSGKARSVVIDETEYSNLLQTDAAINPGNSGGPLIDIAGRLVGLSSVKMAFTPDGMPAQGMGFAIPGDFVRETIAEFMRRGPSAPRAIPANVAIVPTQSNPPVLSEEAGKPSTTPPADRPVGSNLATKISWERFGMQLQDPVPTTTPVPLEFDPAQGVVVSEVEPGSPADQAGLKSGLVIYKVGRYEVKSTKDIEPLFKRVKTGTVVDLAVGILAQQGDEIRQQIETVSLTAR